ncbi:hypothetical protein [Bacillus sp. AFS053548]|uniref:hypothetical protein n=1 Tax=Bacillus sp. AFS053548 TaxID=2033505 RepID=UPI00159BB097|nr:hypothetical protein [Bacillus sp. AFS053548]
MLAGSFNANGGIDDHNFATTTDHLLAENEGRLDFIPNQKVNMLGMLLWPSKTYIIISL